MILCHLQHSHQRHLAKGTYYSNDCYKVHCRSCVDLHFCFHCCKNEDQAFSRLLFHRYRPLSDRLPCLLCYQRRIPLIHLRPNQVHCPRQSHPRRLPSVFLAAQPTKMLARRKEGQRLVLVDPALFTPRADQQVGYLEATLALLGATLVGV